MIALFVASTLAAAAPATAQSALVGGRSATVDPSLLAGLPVVHAELSAHGVTKRCEGPTLSAVLGKLGEPAGKALTGAALRRVVIAQGGDGYRVAFTLAELDPLIGSKLAIIASQCDGKPLDAKDGPFRLVVPGEQRAARSVRQLVALELVSLP
jgi:DMSO/TMAO reductase YedYZ molybdopterin-dependent catalytic subunit